MPQTVLKTTAHSVLAACDGACAYTLSGGYAVPYPGEGERRLFEPCRVVRERRNPAGRVTYLSGAYRDGSHILFTWSQDRGARLAATV